MGELGPSEPPSPDPLNNSTQWSEPPAEEPEPQSAHSNAQEQRQRDQEDFTKKERESYATVANQLAGAPVQPSDGWKGTVVAKQDDLVQKQMNEVKRSSRKAHPGAQNTGEYVDGRGRRLASALAPMDGWYDRRYVAATAPAADLDECEDFRRMFHPDLYDASVSKPTRVSLSMKGILDDPHCRWIAEQLDEKETTAPLHGGDVGWRDKLEKDNEIARKEGAAGVAARKPGCRRLYLNDNPITGEGIEYLADALRRNKTLEELYLHYTDVGDAGLKHLLTMLTENRTLRRLELGGCGIRQGGADMLKTFFTQGGKSNLEHLGLLGNDDEVIDDLADIYRALQSNAEAGKKRRAQAATNAGASDSDDDDDW
mmetsp:Transcript_4351/g.14280  ORF Transcript_4351/g.14280 Transcript_4351/m.14280 type:complete len:370 (+) Transcript_4351:31-1140(+)